MKPNLRAIPLYKTRVINAPSIPATITVKPKAAVQIPSIYTKATVVLRQPSNKAVKTTNRSAARITQKPANTPSVPTIIRPVVRERTLTTVRPSQLRRAHDTLLNKHGERIRALRGSGQSRVMVILACGPSVNDANVKELMNHPKIDIMCINKPEPRVWPTRFWMLCDQSQYMRNQDSWASYNGTIICASSVKATHPNQIMVRTISGKGFSRDMVKGLHVGRSTTYAAMQMALYMGYSKIYIFGCDMSAVNGKMHRYGQNPDVTNDNRAKRFAKEAEHFDFGTNSLSGGERSKFVFCSRHNPFEFVKKYEVLDERDAHEEILIKADELMTKKELELANV